MCFEKPPLSWLLETHVASHYGAAIPAEFVPWFSVFDHGF